MCSFVQNQKLYTMDHSSQKAKRFRRIEEKFDRDPRIAIEKTQRKRKTLLVNML